LKFQDLTLEPPLKRLILLFTVLISCSHLASAQARPTATRTGDLQIGGAFVANFPDYTRHKFYGYGFYADLDFSEHFGIEGEYRQANDTTTRIGGGGPVPQFQRNIEGGIRYHRTYGNFQPYVKAMYGYGVMEYPPYPPPASQAISEATIGYNFGAAGGGIDYRVSPHITVRADLEYQRWFATPNANLGFDYNAGTGGLPNGLTPIVYTGGIAWRFGSGNYVPHGDRRGIH
jgi:opacity protein-like surface antigen